MRDELIKLLNGRSGHFQMESGYHSESWFDLDRLFAHPEKLRPFVSELARRLVKHPIDAICGPMTGGAKLAESIAMELGIAYFFTERFVTTNATGLFPVRYKIPAALRDAVRGKSIAIVDDAISAGSAVRATHANLLVCGARPVALGALFLFGDAGAQFAATNGLALEAIAPMAFPIWKPGQCTLCKAGVPLEKVSDA
jgi:orotate phosphoribosyltransferase